MKLHVRVKPGAGKDEIEKFSDTKKSKIFGVPKTKGFCDDRYLVYLKARAENNEANIALIKMLSKYFGTPSTRIKIKAGVGSRDKIVEVE